MRFVKTALFISLGLCFCLAADGLCQELPQFTLIKNTQVGLSEVPNLEIWGQVITDLDYNGWLDVYLVRWRFHAKESSFFFLNDNGMFQDITENTWIKSVEPNVVFMRTPCVVDYDNDGDRDVFLCSDQRMYLYQNNNMRFIEISDSVGLKSQKPGGLITRWDYNIGAWADFDLDGDLDVVVEQSNYPHLYLYRNDQGFFTDVAVQYGLTNINTAYTSWDGGSSYSRIHWVDFDQDGDPDLSTGPKLFRNDGSRFTEIAASIGLLPCLPIQNSEWFDFDNDGFLDIYLPATNHNHQLWHNDGNGNHWVGFILEGTVSNKEAIGALVTVYAGGRQQIRYRKCPDGWNRQDMPWLHFGLGKNSKIDSVVIRWPMGSKEFLTNVAINQYHAVKESGANSRVFSQDNQTPGTYDLEQNYPNPFNPQTTIQYSVAKDHKAQLVIYNLQGELVRQFIRSHRSAGSYQLVWDGRDAKGRMAPSGAYVYQLTVDGVTESHKMLLLK